VLSRCQRFDLRRVEADRLVGHLESILVKEGVAAEAEALALIARAAEGSVRDALSLIDQAISHAGGAVRAQDVREMLGLADRGRIVDLFAALLRGDVAGALGELRDQYNSGADPLVTLIELAEFTHFVTRVKVVPAVAEDRSLAEMERKRARDFAATLSMPMLSRTWQMLFKGLAEVKEAPRPIAAAEMVLVRIAYAANLPSPEEVVRSLEASQPLQPPQSPQRAQPPQPAAGAAPPSWSETTRAARPAPVAASPSPSPAALSPAAIREMPDPMVRDAAPQPAAPLAKFARFTDLIAFAGDKRDLQLKTALERDVRLVHFEDGKLEIALEPSASKNFIGDLARRLSALTGRRWMVAVSAAAGEPTVKAQTAARQEQFKRDVQDDPLVRHVLARFPGAEIVAVRQPEALSDGAELRPDPPVENDGPGLAADAPHDDGMDDDDVGY
jgi:DNA polymerase III subunit gamma/tau